MYHFLAPVAWRYVPAKAIRTSFEVFWESGCNLKHIFYAHLCFFPYMQQRLRR